MRDTKRNLILKSTCIAIIHVHVIMTLTWTLNFYIWTVAVNIITAKIYSQTCNKRSPLGQRQSGLFRTGDLLKEV
jgi:hypothetical protein